jgi:hypothetical protein
MINFEDIIYNTGDEAFSLYFNTVEISKTLTGNIEKQPVMPATS